MWGLNRMKTLVIGPPMINLWPVIRTNKLKTKKIWKEQCLVIVKKAKDQKKKII